MAAITYPPNFRADASNIIFDAIIAEDSTSVVGFHQVGKTHYALHLCNNHALHDEQLRAGRISPIKCLFVYIDTDAIGTLTAKTGLLSASKKWSGFREILTALVQAANTLDPDLYRSITALYESTKAPEAMRLAFEHLREAVALIIGTQSQSGVDRLVFVLDNFDKLLVRMPTEFFEQLASLRHSPLYHCPPLFVTFSAQSPELLIREENRPKAFLMLLRRAAWLGPYNAADTEIVFDRLQRRLLPDRTLSPHVKDLILYAAGGHGGLLRVCLIPEHIALLECVQDRATAINILLTQMPVSHMCEEICASLSGPELKMLTNYAKKVLVRSGQLVDQALTRQYLENKSLVENPRSNQITMPLLERYLQLLPEKGHPSQPN